MGSPASVAVRAMAEAVATEYRQHELHGLFQAMCRYSSHFTLFRFLGRATLARPPAEDWRVLIRITPRSAEAVTLSHDLYRHVTDGIRLKAITIQLDRAPMDGMVRKMADLRI